MRGRRLAFKILNWYSTLWMSAKAKVEVLGLEKVPPRAEGERRVYVLLNHSTTYDIVALMHISKRPFVIMMDKGAFTFPVIGHVLRRAGFVPLEKDSSRAAFEECGAAVLRGDPLVISLHEGDSTLGKFGPPRTGGIRIAHSTGATLYPIYLKVEDAKIRHLSFKGINGTTYPYTTFRNAVYCIEFLKPFSLASLPPEPAYADFRRVAEELDQERARMDGLYGETMRRLEISLAEARRRGGSSLRVAW